MSYVKMYGHVVISTKCREKSLTLNESHQIYNYICGLCDKRGCPIVSINGMEDHIHILINFINEPSCTLLRDLKSCTSKWIKTEHSKEFPRFTGFGKEYFCSSVSPRNIDAVVTYIRNQRWHHNNQNGESFEDEMRKILLQAGFEEEHAAYYFND